MTIKYLQKDITKENAGLIIHGVNCQKKMGSGVALAIRNTWPQVYKQYMKNNAGADMLGMFDPIIIDNYLTVANCYTQEYYGYDGKAYANQNAIEESLRQAYEYASKYNLILKSPKIGCGLGGLEWDSIQNIYESFSEEFSIKTEIFYI